MLVFVNLTILFIALLFGLYKKCMPVKTDKPVSVREEEEELMYDGDTEEEDIPEEEPPTNTKERVIPKKQQLFLLAEFDVYRQRLLEHRALSATLTEDVHATKDFSEQAAAVERWRTKTRSLIESVEGFLAGAEVPIGGELEKTLQVEKACLYKCLEVLKRAENPIACAIQP